MAIDEINAKGGLLGKKLEPVVVDPASNWPLFAEKAKQLITQDKVAVMFGCWTSVSRKSRAAGVRRNSTACCSTLCSTKAKSCPRTCSTPVRRPTSRPFRPWNT
jgi:ABC-type branched-subunit amino acid transport system substrate-binding protein